MAIDTNQGLLDHMTSYVYAQFSTLQEIMPMWTIVAEDGGVIPVLAPMGGPEEKDLVANIIKKMCQEHKAVRLGFMAESWRSRDMRYANVGVSKDPNREEVITFIVEDCDGQNLSAHIKIVRDEQGKGILQPLEVTPSDTKTSGRFAQMFPRRAVN